MAARLAPISLKILLNELRVIDGDAFLDQTLRALMACREPHQLVGKLLERVQSSLDKFSEGYVRKICASLIIARSGVSETYLTRVEHSEGDDKTAEGLWVSFRSALGKHLQRRPV